MDTEYRFDTRKVSLFLSDGQIRKPVLVQISYFDSYWEEGRGFWGNKKVECMGDVRHLEPYEADTEEDPGLLSNWSRFNLLFRDLPAGAEPKSISVDGISRNNTPLRKVDFTLDDTIESVYAMPGRMPDKTMMGDTPSKVCRKLFAKAPDHGGQEE
jgi:hypothetical protein